MPERAQARIKRGPEAVAPGEPGWQAALGSLVPPRWARDPPCVSTDSLGEATPMRQYVRQQQAHVLFEGRLFDDPNLVSRAGLVPVMGLAERAGLFAPARERADRSLLQDEVLRSTWSR